MSSFIAYLWSGLSTGAVYALVALSVTLVYGLCRIINFAIGGFVMLGAYLSWAVVDSVGNPWLALPVVIVVMGVLGLAAERATFQFTLSRPVAGFLVSLGLIFVISGAVVSIWGTTSRAIHPPVSGVFEVGGALLPKQTVVNTAILLVIFGLFAYGLNRTRTGQAVRAIADDREAAAAMGIPVKRIISLVFVLSAVLSGIAGWIVLTRGTVSTDIESQYVLRAFAVALIGGLGDIRGTVVAGLGLGIAEALAIGYGTPAWSELYVFAAVVAVLLWKPTGLGASVQGARL